jgi:glycogen synthase
MGAQRAFEVLAAAMTDRNVAVVTPWYPSRQMPFRGSFVRAMVAATAPGVDHMTVYHCDEWITALSASADAEIRRAYRFLAPLTQTETPMAAGAGLRHIPVCRPRDMTWGQISRRHAATLHDALGGEPIAAPVIHAHVGILSGWAALRNARPDARVFVTEHASFLPAVLAQPESRGIYRQVLERCAGFFAVGDGVRAPLAKAYPDLATKIETIANPISFSQPRPAPVTELRRWIYVGSLKPTKGVDWLLEAFAICHAEDPSLTLTYVGDGPLAGPLKTRAEELGVADAMTLTGPLAHDAALQLMREHDLLVHPSRSETFGMTIVEAIAAGLPVLVTRCGGPERTLAGIEDAAGELVEVEDAPDAIVAGFRRLRDRFPQGLDLHRAARHLDTAFGYPAVAELHYRAWYPSEAPGSARRGGARAEPPEVRSVSRQEFSQPATRDDTEGRGGTS